MAHTTDERMIPYLVLERNSAIKIQEAVISYIHPPIYQTNESGQYILDDKGNKIIDKDKTVKHTLYVPYGELKIINDRYVQVMILENELTTVKGSGYVTSTVSPGEKATWTVVQPDKVSWRVSES